MLRQPLRNDASSSNCGKQNNRPITQPVDAGQEDLIAVLHQQEIAVRSGSVCFGFLPGYSAHEWLA
jgi:hypothetical protein